MSCKWFHQKQQTRDPLETSDEHSCVSVNQPKKVEKHSALREQNLAKKEKMASPSGCHTFACDLPSVVNEDGKSTTLTLIKGWLSQDSDIHWFVIDEAGETIASTNPEVQAKLESNGSEHPHFQKAKDMLPKLPLHNQKRKFRQKQQTRPQSEKKRGNPFPWRGHPCGFPCQGLGFRR